MEVEGKRQKVLRALRVVPPLTVDNRRSRMGWFLYLRIEESPILAWKRGFGWVLLVRLGSFWGRFALGARPRIQAEDSRQCTLQAEGVASRCAMAAPGATRQAPPDPNAPVTKRSKNYVTHRTPHIAMTTHHTRTSPACQIFFRRIFGMISPRSSSQNAKWRPSGRALRVLFGNEVQKFHHGR